MNNLLKKLYAIEQSFKTKEVQKSVKNYLFFNTKMFASNNSSINEGIIRSLNYDIIILLISLAVMMLIGNN